jgi:putative membrane protein (TIGR04086 family)
MTSNVLVRPASTSWASVLGGWIATIGAAALVAPAVASLLARVNLGGNDLTPTVPVIVGIFVSYLIGGYVAGRMAGYRTSWHGMMTAFFSLFVLLVVALLGYAAQSGAFAGSGINSLADLIPGVRDINAGTFGNALVFGAIIGFLAAIFAGWLGGLLAPSHAVAAYAPAYVAPAGPVAATPVAPRRERREVVRERRPLLPIFGRKGGERVVERREEDVVRRDTDVPRT